MTLEYAYIRTCLTFIFFLGIEGLQSHMHLKGLVMVHTNSHVLLLCSIMDLLFPRSVA